jgi:hypothetical protein
MFAKRLRAAVRPIKRFQTQAAQGEERLWKVWWCLGIPIGWTAAGLVVLAEELRYAGPYRWGDFLDVVRFLVYFLWFRLAWRCSRNVESPLWTPAAQTTLVAGLVCMATF